MVFQHVCELAPPIAAEFAAELPQVGQVGPGELGSVWRTVAVSGGTWIGTCGGGALKAVPLAGSEVPPGVMQVNPSGIDLVGVRFGTSPAWLVPERYPETQRYCDPPLKYYPAQLAQVLQSKLFKKGKNGSWGRPVWDVAGRLRGNWFKQAAGTSRQASSFPRCQ